MSAKTRKKSEPINLRVPRIEQPDEVTCGPTCLAQVYAYYAYEKPLGQIIAETRRNPDGGAFGVYLAISALKSGFATALYSYNLKVFDPTWRELGRPALLEKLEQRRKAVRSRRSRRAISGYSEYLRLGGELRFEELSQRLLAGILMQRRPIITGLNATYLYGTPREFNDEYDDVRGHPAGHFVVLSGYYPKSGRFIVRDPSVHIPFSRSGRYSVPGERLIAAILLGEMTYDAVLLVLSRRS